MSLVSAAAAATPALTPAVLIEVELLAKLSNPNLVSYRHVWLEDVKLHRFGPSVACVFILQQYCNGGDLLLYVSGGQPKETTKEELKAQMRRKSKGHADKPQNVHPSQRHLPFEEIYSLFKDITSGLAYLHAANYIHRDLKPSNCLLHREGRNLICLISDFGEVQPDNVERNSTGSTGTISYCAPEVLRKDSTGRFGNFTTKSDIFSLGMILYFMCFGRLPYQSANAVQEELEDIDLLRAEITDWKGFQDERRERPDLPSKLYQLLKKLLSTNSAERPSANEVLSVMRNESSLDGVARMPGSPSLGLAGRRIQNLDSPVPPGTPVPGPSPLPSVFRARVLTVQIRPSRRSPHARTRTIRTALSRPTTPRPSRPCRAVSRSTPTPARPGTGRPTSRHLAARTATADRPLTTWTRAPRGSPRPSRLPHHSSCRRPPRSSGTCATGGRSRSTTRGCSSRSTRSRPSPCSAWASSSPRWSPCPGRAGPTWSTGGSARP